VTSQFETRDDTVKLHRLERLTELTRQMMGDLGTTDLEEQMQRIAAAARETLEAEACGVFLVADKVGERNTQELILEASVGHREGGFERGKRLAIESREGGGLTGHIAARRDIFKAMDPELMAHFAVKKDVAGQRHTKGTCVSLLAIPLLKRSGKTKDLVGLLRVDNKQLPNGEVLTDRGFDAIDEWIIRLFADIAVVAIENAELMHYRASLISSCPSGVVAVDREGVVTEYNASAAKILGRPRDQAMNQPVRDLYFDPNEPRTIGKKLHAGGGRIEKYDTFVKGLNGEPIPILQSATWVLSGGSSGQRVGSVGYFEDIRDVRKLERRNQLLQAIDLVAKPTDDREDGLQQFTARVVSLLACSYCAVRLMDEKQQVLTLRAASRIDDPSWRPPSGTRLSLAHCPGLQDMLSGGVPRRRQAEDERFRATMRNLSRTMGLDRHLQSVVIGPLTIGGRPIGQLELGERRAARETFSPDEELDLVGTLAAQLAILLDRLNLIEQTNLREKRLGKLANVAAALRAEAELPALLRQVVRLAPDLVEYEVAGIYLHDARKKQFILKEGHGLPRSLVHKEPEAGPLIASVGLRREIQRASSLKLTAPGVELDLADTWAVPLRLPSGDVEGVLFLSNQKPQPRNESIDRDILERLAFHVATAVHTARLLSADRTGARAEILDRITDYILKSSDEDKLYHGFLTGVTASYGLRLNRAFLFLIDDTDNYLVGQHGIGELEQKAADSSWREDEEKGLSDFGRYVERSEAGEVGLSTVSRLIPGMQFEIGGNDLFSKAIQGDEEALIVDPVDFQNLPEFFCNRFRVTSQLVLVPLKTSHKPIGLLVVDNKFTHGPIDTNVVNALTAFARTFTVALENRALRQELDDDEQQLEAFYKMSSDLASITDPEQILNTLAVQTLRVMNAWGATLLLFDSNRDIVTRIPVEKDREVDPAEGVRSNGRTMEVLRTGQAVRIQDVGRESDLNALLRLRGLKAALCVPLSLPSKVLGVIWLHYDQPRRFSDSLVGALQLVLNQATVAYEQAKRIRALEGIREAAESLAATEDFGSVLTEIVHSALRLFHASSAILWLSDGETFLPERSVASGLPAATWERLQSRGPAAMGVTTETLLAGWFGVVDVTTVADAMVPEQMLDFLQSISARGYQSVPLSVGDEKLGVLYLLHEKPVPPGEDQQFIAEEFATHAAWSLKKARLLETVTKAKAAATVVAEAVAGGSSRTVYETLDLIARHSLQALNCGAVVLFASHDGEPVHPAATAGVRNRRAMEDEAETVDYDLVRRLLRSPQPEIVLNVKDHPDFMRRRFVRDEDIQSCAAIPLRAADGIVGVMFVNYRTPHRFTEREVEDIELFASQAATAINSTL
jgi:PAS domain S-box-containing protein